MGWLDLLPSKLEKGISSASKALDTVKRKAVQFTHKSERTPGSSARSGSGAGRSSVSAASSSLIDLSTPPRTPKTPGALDDLVLGDGAVSSQCVQCQIMERVAEASNETKNREIRKLSDELASLKGTLELREKQLSHLRRSLMGQVLEVNAQIQAQQEGKPRGWPLLRQRTQDFQRVLGSNKEKLHSMPEFFAYSFRLGSISVRALARLRAQLRSCHRNWLSEFVHTGALRHLVAFIKSSALSEKQRLADVAVLVSAISCLRCIVQNKIGIDTLITAPQNSALCAVISAFDGQQLLLREVAMEVLTACALFSPTGYRSVIDAFNHLRETAVEPARFFILLHSLRTVSDVHYKLLCVDLLRALVCAPSDVESRGVIREELHRIGLQTLLQSLRDEGDAALVARIETFEEEMREDRREASYQRLSGVKLMDPNSVLHAILTNVNDTPHVVRLSNILKYLLLIPSDSVVGSKVWGMVERSVRRAVTLNAEAAADEVMPSIQEMQEALSSKKSLEESSSTVQRLEQTILRQQSEIAELKRAATAATGTTVRSPKIAAASGHSPGLGSSRAVSLRVDIPSRSPATSPKQQVTTATTAPVTASTSPQQRGSPKATGSAATAPVTPSAAPRPAVKRGGPAPPPMSPPSDLTSAPATPATPAAGGAARRKGPPPAPLLSPPALDGSSPRTSFATPVRKRVGPPLKKLNWTKVVGSKIRGTLWESAPVVKSNELIDESELESLFAMQPKASAATTQDKENLPGSAGTTPSKKPVTAPVTLLDFRRVHTAAILRSQFKMSTTDILAAVGAMNESAFSANDLEVLLKLAPTDDESELLRTFVGDVKSLSEVEQMMWEMNQVPRFTAKLQAIAFRREFSLKCAEILSLAECVKLACHELTSSTALQTLLQIVLEIGNVLNSGTLAGPARGFKLETLLKLKDTRSNDSDRSTLLHYLAAVVDTKCPNVAAFMDTLPHLAEASKVVMVNLQTMVTEMSSALQSLQQELARSGDDASFVATMQAFEDQARPQLQSAKQCVSDALSAYTATATFFCEDAKALPSHELFAMMRRFGTDFEKARSDNTWRQEKTKRMAARKERQATAVSSSPASSHNAVTPLGPHNRSMSIVDSISSKLSERRSALRPNPRSPYSPASPASTSNQRHSPAQSVARSLLIR